MKKLLVIIYLLVFIQPINSQYHSDKNLLLIRCDDIGMSHSVNLAAKELIDTGLKFSASE